MQEEHDLVGSVLAKAKVERAHLALGQWAILLRFMLCQIM